MSETINNKNHLKAYFADICKFIEIMFRNTEFHKSFGIGK
jgi:hypothetical protein